jgi:NAD(P)-dependent dehydrogenase (short-subunit alcohol dehydrogenase family)
MSVAFITGAAHGQGRATALALAEDGYDIVALDVAAPLTYPPYPMGSTEELDSLRVAVERAGRACLPVVADVRDDAAVAEGVRATVERFGRIDVLFNNAGICAYGLAHELRTSGTRCWASTSRARGSWPGTSSRT